MRSTPEVPSKWDANIVASLPYGETVSVIDGYVCAHGGYWWKVRRDNGQVGWIREKTSRAILLAPAH